MWGLYRGQRTLRGADVRFSEPELLVHVPGFRSEGFQAVGAHFVVPDFADGDFAEGQRDPMAAMSAYLADGLHGVWLLEACLQGAIAAMSAGPGVQY